jgi:hypothetical protein
MIVVFSGRNCNVSKCFCSAVPFRGPPLWSPSGMPEAYFRKPWKPTSANNRK